MAIRKKYWIVTLYDPDDLGKEKMSKLIDNGEYGTLRKVCEAVNEALKDREMSIKYGTMRCLGCGDYKKYGENSRVKKIIDIKKVEVNKIEIKYTESVKHSCT